MKPSEEERPPRYSQTLCILGCCQILFQTSVTILELAVSLSVLQIMFLFSLTVRNIKKRRRKLPDPDATSKPNNLLFDQLRALKTLRSVMVPHYLSIAFAATLAMIMDCCIAKRAQRVNQVMVDLESPA
ncbi:hypothetical protein RvY_19054-6 [Ramazzottius varieornatus]|uniref:Uncharacterized protein n=1 Tax=Ramazzottius varieornatus TaxID=947166 RepID=A0A1D1W839_RAMVA|nr:hypothetical protein RvY_19054-6 [Ramazzottius varieornatus]